MNGTPSADHLLLGAGELFFARFDDNGAETGMRHLGNCTKLEVQPNVETLEKASSMDGAHGTYKKVITKTTVDISISLDEFDIHNVSLALLGEGATYSQSSQTGLTAQSINGGSAVVLDRWYFLGKKNLSNVVIKQGVTTLTANTDYELRADAGLVKIKSSGTGTAAVTTWEGDCAAITAAARMYPLAKPTIEGRLYYLAADNQASGDRYEVEWWKVQFSPDGALGFITEEWGAIQLKGTVLKDTTKTVGQEYGDVRELPAA